MAANKQPTLGQLQNDLGNAASIYRAAQDAYKNAKEALKAAENLHTQAVLAMNAEVDRVRKECAVPPLGL